MEPKQNNSDRILEEWNAVSETVRRPVQAPHGSPDRGPGSFLGLVGAGLLAAALVVAVAWLGGRTSGVGADASPSSSDTAIVEPSASPSVPVESVAPSVEPSVEPSVTPEPSVEPSATPEPTPTATPVPTVGPCAAGDLSAKIASWEGAAGNRIAIVTMTNTGSATCTMPQTTVPQLVDVRGTVLAQGTGTPSGRATLRPDGVLNSQVDVTNVCKTPVVAPVTIAYDLGGGVRVVSDPQNPTDSTVPPCNGPGQPASIQMKAWMH